MRASRILAQIRRGNAALVASQCYAFPVFPQHAAANGYDGIWIENEHHPWNPRDLQSFLHIIQLLDLDAMVRPPTREKAALYQLLDQGATGILVPQISSAAEARACVEALKFPPVGERSMDGAGLDTRCGTAIPADYPEFANRERFFCAMIETPAGVRAADAIASVEGVDLIFIGPADLLLRMGKRFDLEEPAYLDAQRQIQLACKRHGKAWGRPCISADDVGRAIDAGAQLVVHGSDFRALTRHLRTCAEEFRDRCATDNAPNPEQPTR